MTSSSTTFVTDFTVRDGLTLLIALLVVGLMVGMFARLAR